MAAAALAKPIRRDQAPLYQDGDIISFPAVQPIAQRKSLSSKARQGTRTNTANQGKKSLREADTDEYDEGTDVRVTDDLLDDDVDRTRGGQSSPPVRRASYVASRRTTTQQYAGRSAALPDLRTRAQMTTTHRRSAHRVHWLLPAGIGMVVMLLIYLGISWVHVQIVSLQDDWTYGTTRTFHLDAVVGHADSLAHPTHLLAINSRGQVVIIEFPGGDLAHAKIYPGPHLPWSDAATSVITLSLRDVTRDGKPDLVISIRQEPTLLSSWWNPPLTTLVMVNTGSGFKPAVQQAQP